MSYGILTRKQRLACHAYFNAKNNENKIKNRADINAHYHREMKMNNFYCIWKGHTGHPTWESI